MNTLTGDVTDLEQLGVAWVEFNRMAQLRPLTSEADYDHAAALLRRIWDKVDGDPQHPLESLLDLLLSLVSDYEEKHHSLGKSEPHGMLAFLMEQAERTPADLEVVLDRTQLAEVLAGKKKIDADLAKRLADFFCVTPKLFLEE